MQPPLLKHLSLAAAFALMASAASAADYAYIPNSGSQTLSVINTASGELTATLKPSVLDATLNQTIYTAALRPGSSNEAWFGQIGDKVGVIDTTNNSLKAVITGTGSVALTFSADGATAYVSDYSGQKIHVVNATTKQVTASVAAAACSAIASALSADGASLYVRCGNTGTVKRLDTANNTISTIATVSSSSGYGLAYDPTGAGKLYVNNNMGANVARVNLADNSVTQIAVTDLTAARTVAVRKNGSKLYVGGSSNVLSIIDTANTAAQTTLTLSGTSGITGLGISANDAALYVVRGNGSVNVIDLATDTVTKTIAAAAGTSSGWVWGDFLGNVNASAAPGGPSVSSIAPQGTPLASATSMDFTVAFSEAVSGVDASDFTLTPTGTAAGTLGTPVSSDGVTWTVPVTAISGTGSLRLDLNSSATGIESTGTHQPIAGGFTAGTVHTVDVPPTPQAGACGAAAGQPTALLPASGLCSVGTPSAVASASGQYTWQCQGLNGGSASSCQAPWSNAGGSKGSVALQPANGWQVNSASFSTTPPAPAPQGLAFPAGLLALNLSSGTQGSDATVTLQFSTPVPAGAVYMKYGPSPDGFNCQGTTACAQPHWYELPASRAVLDNNRLSATLTLTDGGLGDFDGAANQFIQDPGGFAVKAAPAPTGPQAIPTLSEWGVLLLSALAAAFGLRAARRRV